MIIELSDISKEFPKSSFKLENISFGIKKGEIVGLIGSNGTEKALSSISLISLPKSTRYIPGLRDMRTAVTVTAEMPKSPLA
ncbi:hypothetical protein ACVRY7_08785, partial [Streptococcus ictaluri]